MNKKLADLKPWEQNPRGIKTEDFQRLKNQIKELGLYKPFLITEDGTVLGGNMRLRACQELGIEDVPVTIVKAETDAEKIKYALSDNDRAGYYDEESLAELLFSIEDLDLNDYKIDLGPLTTIEEFMDQFRPEEEEDDVPDLPEGPADSQPGEIYELGQHRLICGDATNPEHFQKLMNGKKANMVFTDPPYNIDYQGGGLSKREGIMNDNMSDSDFYQFLRDSIGNMMEHCDGSYYICMAPKELPNLKRAFEDAGGHWQSFIIWVKNTFTLSGSDYQNQYEPILYGWNKKNKNHYFVGYRNIGNVWYETKNTIRYKDGKTFIKIGDVKVELEGKVAGKMYRRKKKTDVWAVDKPSRSEEHPTMKPVRLVSMAIRDSSRPGEIILDPFGGSGSTLIASEQSGRICYMSELDPRYCDVIRQRYDNYITSQKQGNEQQKQ